MNKFSEAARLLGQIKTEKKAAASRANGRAHGGRKPGGSNVCPLCSAGWASNRHQKSCKPIA